MLEIDPFNGEKIKLGIFEPMGTKIDWIEVIIFGIIGISIGLTVYLIM